MSMCIGVFPFGLNSSSLLSRGLGLPVPWDSREGAGSGLQLQAFPRPGGPPCSSSSVSCALPGRPSGPAFQAPFLPPGLLGPRCIGQGFNICCGGGGGGGGVSRRKSGP